MVPARRCFQPFDKHAGAVCRPRHFDIINSNFQRQPQRWVYQCRLASAVQKPPPAGLLSQTGHSSYEGYGHPGNVLLSSGLRLSKFNLTRWVAYPYMPHAGAQGAASRADDALLGPSAGYTSADLLRQYRNLLHPAYCLKQDVHPTKDTGTRATFFCLVAYASLSSI